MILKVVVEIYYYFFYNIVMNDLFIITAIVIVVLLLFYWLKPYFLKYDNTILFTGGIGSGKSLNSVKTAVRLYKRNLLKVKFKNLIRKIKKQDLLNLPRFYSNMPVKINGKFCDILTKDILTLNVRIPEFSIVLIDELSAVVNQYNWNIDDVKYHLNEFIQFFRHYIGGYLIVNAQAESEIVKQVRTKLNSYFWCFNFQKFFIFYRVRILHCQVTENETSLSSEFIEENTKRTYGILTKAYNSRYLKNRYLNIDDIAPQENFDHFTYNKVVRFVEYQSKCDDRE